MYVYLTGSILARFRNLFHSECLGPQKGVSEVVAHCCTIFLGHLGIELQLDDRHRNPNMNIREIIWLGNQLVLDMPPKIIIDTIEVSNLHCASQITRNDLLIMSIYCYNQSISI